MTARTFTSELTGQDSLTSFTDDDGDNWTPSQGGGIPSGVDHQAIGAGPFHAPLTGVAYPDAIYYCSQDIVAAAFCSRRDTGGLNPQPIGRVYAAFGSGDSIAGVSVSDDRGATWKNSFDVGSLVGIKAVAFPAIVAGDDERAAYAFLGSTTAGAPDDKAFPGLWHLYVATTADGGSTWQVTDATPNDPVQRNGIHLGGGSPPHRNLLDFIGIDVDKDGRILIGYADGCTGPGCVQAPDTATGNSYTEVAAIARQSGGRRMFAATDPSSSPTVPGVPNLTVGRDDGVAKLTWSEADNGGSAVTNYW